MVNQMQLAGKYSNTSDQYPTIQQELNKQLSIVRLGQPGSPEVAQAMAIIAEIQNAVKGFK